jgi:phosphate transport system ATP-binding protein
MHAAANPAMMKTMPFAVTAHHDPRTVADLPLRMSIANLNFFYGAKQALFGINLGIAANRVTALIGPSGCGKSTLLRVLNRMYETLKIARVEGTVLLDGASIFAQDVTQLRRRVGMVFQRPNPFPKSIFENVAYGLRINGISGGSGSIAEAVEQSLRRAALWDEVKDQLHKSAFELSGGQQQRLCIARALAVNPEVLLLDEPCSALDPRSTAVIEELLMRLKQEVAIVIVTHNLQQANRIGDQTAFMYLGELVEYGTTDQVFDSPRAQRTRDYVAGTFG